MGHVFISADTRLRIHDLIKHTEGMTQAKLAKELGISESTLSRFLSGQTTKMGNDRIIKIANIFDVSTDFLLGETNIPVKKNYDISELGLSAEAAQALYTHKVNTEIVCQLLESTKFAALTNLLANYQKEVFATGMAAMNQNMDFLRSLMLGQARLVPEDKAAASAVASDLQSLKLPPVSVDTAMIQNVFNQILHELREKTESHLKESITATRETLEQFRRNLTKGQDAVDLRTLTPEDITSAVLMMVPEGALPEKGIQFWTYAETVVRNGITDYIRKIISEYEFWGNMLSLNASISDEDSEERSFEETIPDEHSKTPEQIYIEKENLSEIHDALNRISARERDYLCYRFGFDDDEYHDKTDTADHFMMSKSWAGKLEKSALDNFSLELPWWY